MGKNKWLRQEPCPSCGSKNNVNVWYSPDLQGEIWYCYTKGCENNFTEYDLAREKGIEDYKPRKNSIDFIPGSFYLPDLEYGDLKNRKIPKHICQSYGIGCDPDGRLVFPFYHDEYGLIAAKVAPGYRDGEKYAWYSSGAPDLAGFFGEHFIPSTHDLILVEGLLDAPAAHSMTGYTCWSVKDGAKSAANIVRERLQKIEQFRTVYICFDNDEDGMRAATEVYHLLAPGLAKLVILPRIQVGKGLVTKDPCDFTKYGKTEEFLDAIKAAKARKADYFIEKGKLWSKVKKRIYSPEMNIGETTGIHKLDELLKWRVGEISLILAGVSVGKSTSARWFMVQQLLRGKKCLYIPLEDGDDLGVTKIMEMIGKQHLLAIDNPIDEQKLEFLFDHATENLEVINMDKINTWAEIKEAIAYAIRQKGVEYVLIDHLMWIPQVREKLKNGIVQSILKECKDIVNKYGGHIWIINHINRQVKRYHDDEETDDMTIGFGGAGNEQSVDNLIVLDRKSGARKTTIKVAKQRLTGMVGEFDLYYKNLKFEEHADYDTEEEDNQEEEAISSKKKTKSTRRVHKWNQRNNNV